MDVAGSAATAGVLVAERLSVVVAGGAVGSSLGGVLTGSAGASGALIDHVQFAEAGPLFPAGSVAQTSKLWLPGGWAGRYGAYQSQLKVLMGLLGQPTGDVRPPRLPVTDERSIAEMRRPRAPR